MSSKYATQRESPNRTETNKYLCADGNWKVPAGGGGGGTASDIEYDNSTSGLLADNVQDAIDEVNGNLESGTGISTGEIPYTDGSARIYRRGNIVNVIFSAKITASNAGWKTLVTIPDNIPKPKYYATFIFSCGGYVNNGDINTDGLVRLSWPAGATVSSIWCFFNCMYLI